MLPGSPVCRGVGREEGQKRTTSIHAFRAQGRVGGGGVLTGPLASVGIGHHEGRNYGKETGKARVSPLNLYGPSYRPIVTSQVGEWYFPSFLSSS